MLGVQPKRVRTREGAGRIGGASGSLSGVGLNGLGCVYVCVGGGGWQDQEGYNVYGEGGDGGPKIAQSELGE